VSRSHQRANRPERLSEAALAYLDAGLQAIKNAPNHAHARRVERLAVTYRPCKRGSDRLPEGRIEFDAFRLMSLSSRWCDRSGVVSRIVVLGTYQPVVDLPGTARITFQPVGAMTVGKLGVRLVPDARTNLTGCRTAVLLSEAIADADPVDLSSGILFPAFYFGFDRHRPPVFEGPRPVEDWLAEEVKIGNLRAWPAEFFARPLGARYDVHPVDGSTDPFAEETGLVEEGTIRGGWVMRDGRATPLAQVPRDVVADLSGLKGRAVRNPSWRVLQEHKVIRPGLSYRQFLERLSPYTGQGRDAPDPLDPLSEAGRFRIALMETVDRDGLDALFEDTRDACQAAGVPVPSDEEYAYEFITCLLEEPWRRPEIEGVAGIQRVYLGCE
jgi:hypothetical protein